MSSNKVKNYRRVTWILIALVCLAYFLFLSIRWAANRSGLTNFEQIIFVFRAPSLGVSPDMIWHFIWSNVVPPVLLGAFLSLLVKTRLTRLPKFQKFLLIGLSFSMLALVKLTFNFVRFDLHVSAFIENQQILSTFIEDHYVDPAEVQLEFPKRPRNLIHIYLESMETTFMNQANGGAFEVNLIPRLTELAREGVTFSQNDGTHLGGALVPVNTTWTSASLFAHTAGLPLNVPISQDNIMMDALFLTYEDIPLFPSAVTTFGEILEAAGYRQVFMAGSDAHFGDRKYYFENNGNYEIFDHPLAIEKGLLPYGYHVWWGFEDYHLFNFAKDKLVELGEGDVPFNFTMLTVDTHFEDGYLSDFCAQPHPVKYANVISCSDQMVYNFVRWIQDQPFYYNTTIVITGDHLTMQSIGSDFWAYFPVDEEAYQRRTFHTILNADVEAVDGATVYREFTTMDFFPTILASLGVGIEGERLGLGTNLFSGYETLVEQFGFAYMNQEILRRSTFFESLMLDVE